MINDLNEKQRRLLDALKFLLGLTAFGLVFRTADTWLPPMPGVQSAYADLIAVILQPLGQVDVSGFRVRFEGVNYLITRDCLGWKSWSALTGLTVASFDRSLSYRAKGVAAGAILILLLNTLRISSTIYLANLGIGFDLLHTVTWRWGMTATILALWLAWRKNPSFLN